MCLLASLAQPYDLLGFDFSFDNLLGYWLIG